jgi:hypothetical protein
VSADLRVASVAGTELVLRRGHHLVTANLLHVSSDGEVSTLCMCSAPVDECVVSIPIAGLSGRALFIGDTRLLVVMDEAHRVEEWLSEQP